MLIQIADAVEIALGVGREHFPVFNLVDEFRWMQSEEGRRVALLALRLRGRFDDVREGLIEAYRFEPSRRVAQEIGAAIVELAHR